MNDGPNQPFYWDTSFSSRKVAQAIWRYLTEAAIALMRQRVFSGGIEIVCGRPASLRYKSAMERTSGLCSETFNTSVAIPARGDFAASIYGLETVS